MNNKEIYFQGLIKKIVKEEVSREIARRTLSSRTEKELKEQYVPYKLTHSFCGFGSYLFENKENKYGLPNEGYSVPLDKVKEEISIKYGLKDWQFTIRKQYGNVEIAIVIADIDDNAKLIERDMVQLGYFIGHSSNITAKDGTVWLQMQFEPKYQKELEVIKKKHMLLAHISPIENLESIRTKGFIPSSKNNYLSYPDRVYLYVGGNDIKSLLKLMKLNYISTGWNDERYCLFLIDSFKVPKNVKFFIDPNMENGIYTYDHIPYSAVFQEITLDMSSGKILSSNQVN